MKQIKIILFVLFNIFFMQTSPKAASYVDIQIPKIVDFTLKNGLKVLVQPSTDSHDVSMKMFYHVGSKDEKENEKGLAHLLEHMIFKGTKKLSELDIDLIVDKLSGWCNASTSYDRTCYDFNFPKRHWKKALPILADCMANCTFKDDHLNSEFKAVIQELKMRKDDYGKSVLLELMSISFPDHPYHFPVIGYKQDIWDVTGKELHKFYRKHYIPNNAVLVVVGDVDPAEVLRLSEKHFSNIPGNPEYKKKSNFLTQDLVARSTTLYRDIKSSKVYLSFVIPGLKDKKTHVIKNLESALTRDNFARLSKILVEEKGLTYSVECAEISLYEFGMFWIIFEPKDINKSNEISEIIIEEITKLQNNGLTDFEIKKIHNQIRSSNYDLLQDNEYKAETIGEYYLASKDYEYPFRYSHQDKSQINNELKSFIKEYLRPCVMYQCKILPIPENEKSNWYNIQDMEDKRDQDILNQRIRESELEKPNYANKITPKPITEIITKVPKEVVLKNGLKVLFVKDKKAPKIDLVLYLKANRAYEPKNKPGILDLMYSLLPKGTNKHSYEEIVHILTRKAIDLYFDVGTISLYCLNTKFETAISIMNEMITDPLFPDHEIKIEKDKFKNDIKSFWDSPRSICSYLANKAIYKEHLSAKKVITEEQVDSYTREDLVDCYKKFVTPDKSYVVISGDIKFKKVIKVLEETLANWTGQKIEGIDYGKIKDTETENIHFTLDRDQTHLTIATKAINYLDPDYHKLYLASVILSSGMSSKLFLIREQTGLFYTCNGSFVSNCTEFPGIFHIKTIVSNDNVEKSKEIFRNLINNFSQIITEDDLTKAKNQLLERYSVQYSTRNYIVSTIAHLYYYNQDWNFYKSILNKINSISLRDVKEAVEKFAKKEFVTVTVGR